MSGEVRRRTIPEGNTEVRFRMAALCFKSVSYEWPVVSGDRAQFKGAGEIDGAGDYGFIFTAIDREERDRFRIKIWDWATNAIVYDNEIGRKDDGDPATMIEGGQIVIHSSRGTKG